MKNRILFLVCFCVIASTALLGIIVYDQVKTITKDQAVASIAVEARRISERFDRAYADVAQDLRTFNEMQPVRDLRDRRRTQDDGTAIGAARARPLLHRMEAMFAAVLRTHPEYLAIRFVALNEAPRELVRVERTGDSVVTREPDDLENAGTGADIRFGAAVPSGQVAFSDARSASARDTGPTRPTISGMLPVDAVNGDRLGLLVIDADYTTLLTGRSRREINGLPLFPLAPDRADLRGARDATDGRVSFQLRSDPSQPLSPLTLEVLSQSGREGLLETGETVAYYVRDPGRYSQQSAQIGFAVQMPLDELFSHSDAVKARVITLCLLAAVVFGAIAVVAANRFIRPLGVLTRLVSETPDATLSSVLPTERDDEIGDLARSFRARTQALVDSEARAKVIVNTAPDGLFLIDADGYMEEFNPSCERMFGYSATDVVGRHVEFLLNTQLPDYESIYADLFDTLEDPGQAGQKRELEAISADGAPFPVEIGISTLTVEGRTKFSGFIRDISQRREIDRMRTEFVANVSHELRTPLTSIRGALVLIDKLLPPPRADKINRMLEMAHKNTARLILLVNDILDFEKLQARKTQFAFTRCDINIEIAKAVELNTTYAQDRKVALNALPADEPLVCSLDKDRLQQILANLISNAAKYSNENGIVDVAAEHVGETAVIRVIDFGTGIPEEFQDEVFTPFSQADTSASAKRSGTGLGLNITQRLVEGMDGTIDFTSIEGQGTTFWVTFPLSERPGDDTAEAPAPERDRLLALHLEDDPDFSEILQAGLDDRINLINATTLTDARRRLAEQTFDLIVIDVELDGENGTDLIDDIPDPQTTPIVLLTALDDLDPPPAVDLVLVKTRHRASAMIHDIRKLALTSRAVGRALREGTHPHATT